SGPEAYGTLADSVETYGELTDVRAERDQGAIAFAKRLAVGPGEYGYDFPGLDVIVIGNLSAGTLADPKAVSKVHSTIGTVPPSAPQALAEGGPARDILFGGNGMDAILSGLAPGQVFMYLIPSGHSSTTL